MATNTYEIGSADDRPWGRWTVLDAGAGFVVKRIQVKPGARLSLQRHRGRDEHWVMVQGQAQVTRDADRLDLTANQSVFITAGMAHRIENTGADELVFIEVQTGALLDEADIERLSDDYGRG